MELSDAHHVNDDVTFLLWGSAAAHSYGVTFSFVTNKRSFDDRNIEL
jgi:hypothetical protein